MKFFPKTKNNKMHFKQLSSNFLLLLSYSWCLKTFIDAD